MTLPAAMPTLSGEQGDRSADEEDAEGGSETSSSTPETS